MNDVRNKYVCNRRISIAHETSICHTAEPPPRLGTRRTVEHVRLTSRASRLEKFIFGALKLLAPKLENFVWITEVSLHASLF